MSSITTMFFSDRGIDSLVRFRLVIGTVCLIVSYLSASFAHVCFHGPDQGMPLNLLRFLFGEVASAVSVAAFLGLIWAAFAPRWVAGLFRHAWRHLKYALYVFYGMLVVAGIYGAVLRIFGP